MRRRAARVMFSGPPRLSLYAQIAILLAAALFAGQVIGFFLIFDQQQRQRLVEASGPSMSRFAAVVRRASALRGDGMHALLRRESQFNSRFSAGPQSRIAMRRLRRRPELETQLLASLTGAGVRPTAVEASIRQGASIIAQRGAPGRPPDFPQESEWRGAPGAPAIGLGAAGEGDRVIRLPPPDGPRFGDPAPPPDRDLREVTLSAQLPDGVWINMEAVSLVPRQGFWARIIAAEILIYLAILAATLFIAQRIARPLSTLARAAAAVGGAGPPPEIKPDGPREVSTAIEAFNVMSVRVAGLLREKDQLLGAIGHDLRTPVASLRIRVEALSEPDRTNMIETLEEMTQLLEDSLDLARLGQTGEVARLVDMSALADSLVESYRDLGLDAHFIASPRAPVLCKPALTRRMLRNLIDNALKFGKRADVAVAIDKDGIQVIITDRGPGVPDDEMKRVLEPFVRLELSRNRETGGAGLGLAIATRIAAAEGAELRLANNDGGGLRASVHWMRKPA